LGKITAQLEVRMPKRASRHRALALRRSAVIGAVAMVALPVPQAAGAVTYTNVLTNPDFAQPGIDGDAPTGWTESYFDNETDPFDSSIAEYDASGEYPPPAPVPGGNTFAQEIFYEAGSSTGSEGDGASQAVTGLTQADDPQVGYSTVETYSPATSVAAWAGSVFEVDFTSGPQAYQLRYFDPWTPETGSYGSAPSTGATTKYIVGPTLSSDVWYTQAPRDLSTDILNEFGLSTYTVTGVHYGTLEDATSAASPYPNMTAYFAGLDLASDAVVGPVSETPESPLVVALPVAAVLVAGGVLWLSRRRRTRPAA
jgi:hypothetical protein